MAARHFDDLDVHKLKMIGDAIRRENSMAVALLTSRSSNGAGVLCCVAGDNAIQNRGMKAGDLVGKAAVAAGGGGGGRPHMATAGTKKPNKLVAAIREFPRIVQEAMKSD